MKRRRLLGAVALASATLTLSSFAIAADLGLPPASPPPIPAYIPFSWTGLYIGGNLGLAWSQSHGFTDSLGNTFGSVSENPVFTGGGQVGANYQMNYWLVIGVEADFDWMSNNNNLSDAVGIGSNTFKSSANDRWITTLAGRVGVAVERALFYVKGGGGWVGANQFTLTNVVTGASISGSNNGTNSGWLAGAGFEYAFSSNWTAKVEYDFLALTNSSFTVPAGATGFPIGDIISTNNRDIQTLTIGFNYLFNWH